MVHHWRCSKTCLLEAMFGNILKKQFDNECSVCLCLVGDNFQKQKKNVFQEKNLKIK